MGLEQLVAGLGVSLTTVYDRIHVSAAHNIENPAFGSAGFLLRRVGRIQRARELTALSHVLQPSVNFALGLVLGVAIALL